MNLGASMPSSPAQVPVNLRPAEPRDPRNVFAWLVNAYAGPFFCTEEAPPTWEEFCSDYQALFFDGSAPEKGRVYIITQGDDDIGAVSYDARFRKPGEADIDIWLAREDLCGQGLGSAALRSLSVILKESLGFERLIISPCGNNTRAVRAYLKTGFKKLDLPHEELRKRFGPLDCSHAQVMLLGV
jgi:RimJ/RimL family protein N-acetyltransferase